MALGGKSLFPAPEVSIGLAAMYLGRTSEIAVAMGTLL